MTGEEFQVETESDLVGPYDCNTLAFHSEKYGSGIQALYVLTLV